MPLHHATSGNLDRRGMGDIDTLTVGEYLSLSRWGRLRYRLYRHPLVMFGLGPAYLFFLQHRLPVGLMRAGWQPWLSTMATNLAIVLVAAVTIWAIGFGPFLLVQVPVMLISASLGVWLFYVQHQFEDTFWAARQDLEPARGGAARQFALRSADRAALVHGEYRRPSRPSSVQQDSVLSLAAGAAPASGTGENRPAHAGSEHSLRAPGTVGRSGTPADQLSRAANAARLRRRIDRRSERSRLKVAAQAELRPPACPGTPAPASIAGSQCRQSRSCWPSPCAAAAPSRPDPCP